MLGYISAESGGDLIGDINDSPCEGFQTLAVNTTTHNDLPADPHSDSGNGYTYLEVWLQAKNEAAQSTATKVLILS